MAIKGIIFDLDGVIVSTDECHFNGWKRLAENNGIPFTREDNLRLRGVSRMESLDILLEKSEKNFSEEEKIEVTFSCKLRERASRDKRLTRKIRQPEKLPPMPSDIIMTVSVEDSLTQVFWEAICGIL